jgi:hypothetical protein
VLKYVLWIFFLLGCSDDNYYLCLTDGGQSDSSSADSSTEDGGGQPDVSDPIHGEVSDAGLGSDLGSDAGPNPGHGSGSDAGSDAGSDVGSDAGSDAGSDVGSDVDAATPLCDLPKCPIDPDVLDPIPCCKPQGGCGFLSTAFGLYTCV